MEKEITHKQTYTINVFHYKDGTNSMSRENDGFNAIELIGIMEHAQLDVLQQMAGKIKPTVVKRKVKI